MFLPHSPPPNDKWSPLCIIDVEVCGISVKEFSDKAAKVSYLVIFLQNDKYEGDKYKVVITTMPYCNVDIF